MKKLFEYDQNIADWRVLVQTKDVQNGAIKARHIADGAITGEKIGNGEVSGKNIADGAVTEDKIAEKSVTGQNIAHGAIGGNHIVDEAVTGDEIGPNGIIPGKIADDAVSTRNLQKGCVTPEKLSNDVPEKIVTPLLNNLDEKYSTKVEEIYAAIRSLQVGGVALSKDFGDREDVGITQKKLTEVFWSILSELAEITGKVYVKMNMSIDKTLIYSEFPNMVRVIADCTDSIASFTSIKIYVDDTLVAESQDTYTFVTDVSVSKTSTIKAVGVIAGQVITKEQEVIMKVPFFMGSGQTYTDVINDDCLKVLDGTLEGDYDVVVKNNNDHIFIIIPITRKDEFRRADMNGYEIPLVKTVTEEYVVYKSANKYSAGTYNIDIDINT